MLYLLSFIGGAGLTGIILDGMALSDAVAFTIAAGGGIGGLAGARAGIALWTKRQKTRLSMIADRIKDVVSAEEPTESDASTDDSIPRMELPDDEDLDTNQARNSDLRDRTRL